MASINLASENVRARSNKSPPFLITPITTEMSASGDGVGADKDLSACSGARRSFTINFCNIRGLPSDFLAVEHHLSSSKPHLLFLTETKVDESSDSNQYSVSSYHFYPKFSLHGGCCAYVRNDVICSRAPDLESSEFSTLWLRLSCQSTTKFICAVYLHN